MNILAIVHGVVVASIVDRGHNIVRIRRRTAVVEAHPVVLCDAQLVRIQNL